MTYLSYLTYWMYIFKKIDGRPRKKNNRRQISVYNNARGWLVVCFDRVHFSVHIKSDPKKMTLAITKSFQNIESSNGSSCSELNKIL